MAALIESEAKAHQMTTHDKPTIKPETVPDKCPMCGADHVKFIPSDYLLHGWTVLFKCDSGMHYGKFIQDRSCQRNEIKLLRAQLAAANAKLADGQLDSERLADKFLKAQKAVQRILIAYRRHLMGDWYEATAKDCGLELDEIGFIKEPTRAAIDAAKGGT